MTCGEEMAANAEVPEQLSRLFTHVAQNMDAHARWVGTTTPEARAEHAAMLALAADYRAIASAADRAVVTMRKHRNLPAAPHDPRALDKAAFSAWMTRKMELQRAFARLLLEHAELSEQGLREMTAR